MDYKKYLKSLRFFIILSLIIFSLAIVQGYQTAQDAPQEIEKLIREFEGIYQPILKAHPLIQFPFIFFNNSLTVFLTIILAVIFGLFPFLVLLVNGLILGVFISVWDLPWLTFLKGILPHGLVEIPVLLIAAAIGLKIGQTAFRKVFRKEGRLKPELSQALNFFLKILLPLLALAALLEVFVTPLLFK